MYIGGAAPTESTMKEIGLGLLGFGTVGAGVVEGLQQNGDLLAARFDPRIKLA